MNSFPCATELSINDPYTITIAPTIRSDGHTASGTIYHDDEHTLLYTFDSNSKHSSYYNVVYTTSGSIAAPTSATIRSTSVNPVTVESYQPSNTVERVELLGQTKPPTKVVMSTSKNDGNGIIEEHVLSFSYDSQRNTVTIKKPDMLIASAWTIRIEY